MHSSSWRAHGVRVWRGVALATAALAATLVPRLAAADVSSWAFVGGGVSRLSQSSLTARNVGSMRVHFGLGTDPSHALIVGGLFSIEPHFGYGSDLALSLRTASRGYANGNFGLAVDLGGYERFWGPRSVGGTGTVWLGAPWGICLGLGGSAGSHDAAQVSAILGIDFARLTIYRTTGTSWLMNPFPPHPDRARD